jgi:hypothetical protein
LKFWAGLFLLGAGLGCILGWQVWPGILAGADAAPFRAVLRALAVPAGSGALGVAVAFAVRRFAEDRFLWLAVVAAVCAVPATGVLPPALLALAAGCAVLAWRGDTGFSFFAGACGGFAVWVTPAALPAVLLAMAPLFVRWLRVPDAAVPMSCAAGFVDVMGFGYAIHPPKGGYLAMDIHHLSVLYVLLGVALLGGAGVLRRLQKSKAVARRSAGAATMAGLLLLWFVLFLYYAWHGNDFKPLIAPAWRFSIQQAAGILALVYVSWRAIAARGGWFVLYLAGCILVLLALGFYFPLYACFPAVIAAALAPVALSELLQKLRKNPGLTAPWPEA